MATRTKWPRNDREELERRKGKDNRSSRNQEVDRMSLKAMVGQREQVVGVGFDAMRERITISRDLRVERNLQEFWMPFKSKWYCGVLQAIACYRRVLRAK